MKKIILSSIFLISFSIQAQLKIGANPSQLVSGASLQINGGTTPNNNTPGGPVSDDPNTFIYTTIESSGRVGINTLRPDGQLDIVSKSPLETAIILSNTSVSPSSSEIKGHKYILNSIGYNRFSHGGFMIWDATAVANRFLISNNGNVGIGTGTANPAEKLDVYGGIIANSIQGRSDIRFKKNIVPLKNSLLKVTALNSYTYEWRTDEFPDKDFKKGIDMGLIAQEVEKVFPEVVFTANDEMQSKSIDYSKLVPVLVESIKELKAEVDLLKIQLAKTKEELASAK